MPTSRRRISAFGSLSGVRLVRTARHFLVGLAIAAAVVLPPSLAFAQATRAWAGGTDATREPLRVATVPTAANAAEAEPQKLIPTGNLLSTIRDGGLLMVPLLGCSFALAVFGIERAVNLRTAAVVPTIFAERLISQLQDGSLSRGAALDACDENGSPVARVFAAALRRWGRPAVEIEQAAIDAGERELNRLRRYRRVFNGVATISPLLGLLGTVFGLIRSFNEVAAAGAMGRPDLLAGGFGEALITTAMGLLVAIPAMILHSYFTSRVDRLAMRLDEACQQVIDEISQESQQAEPRRRKAG
jgi:biopolymer transport protein ExbB